MSTVTFDARPLTEPVSAKEARAYLKQLKAQGRAGGMFSSPGKMIASLVIVVFVLVVFTIIATVFASVFTAIASSGGGIAWLGGVLPVVVLLLVFGGFAAIFITVSNRRAIKTYRLDRFAQANGMSFVTQVDRPQLPGMIFDVGRSRKATDLMRGHRPRFVEFANYQYTTGSGKSETTHTWGYVAVKLNTPLPHIVLDAVGNNGLFGASNLPASFSRDQRLGLEGDFDRYFSLYCPRGYERDALYLFTPDIMARFIDHAAEMDVEIVDDWLFLYGKRNFSTLDPALWQWLFSVVAALLDKFAQWERWRDERLAAQTDAVAAGPAAAGAAAGADVPEGFVTPPPPTPAGLQPPPPGVAEPGLRLKRGFPLAAVLIAVAVGVFWLVTNFGTFGAVFFR